LYATLETDFHCVTAIYIPTAIVVLLPGGSHQNYREVFCRRFQTTQQAEAAVVDGCVQEWDYQKAVSAIELQAPSAHRHQMRTTWSVSIVSAAVAAAGQTVDKDDACSWIS
jgi:hypothetical protein